MAMFWVVSSSDCVRFQKFLVVTTNLTAARKLGVPKMVAITEALAK